jgi:hypothetical protein
MPTWGNTDNHNQKPKMDVERETREILQLTVRTGNTAGNNIVQIAYNDGAGNNVANIGVAVNQYVYFYVNGFANPGGTAGNGYPGFFASNTQVSAISGNTITLSTNLFNTVSAGYGVEFDKAIVYNSNKTNQKTYGQDTVLVTPTRLANSTVTLGNLAPGWVAIQKSTNNDGTVRYRKEVLVALANPTAANTNSGNTSWGQAFTGL